MLHVPLSDRQEQQSRILLEENKRLQSNEIQRGKNKEQLQLLEKKIQEELTEKDKEIQDLSRQLREKSDEVQQYRKQLDQRTDQVSFVQWFWDSR